MLHRMGDLVLHRMIFNLGWAPRSVPHVHYFAESSEIALAGPDGERAAHLLAASKARGASTLSRLTERAVRRLLAIAASTGTVPAAPVLFDDAELRELQDAFQATIATADLLGRSRVRRFAAKYADIAKFAEGDSGGAWAPYTGPKGGTGWKNGATGEVRYQAEKPGDEESGIADKPDAEVKAEKPKEPKAEKEWDGVINDDDVLHRPRDREQIDTWKEYDDPSEGGHEHSVKVQHGTYTLPNGEDIDVYRWENHRTHGDITEKGEWTKSESEARREARDHARANHQDAPEPDDSDIPSRLSGPSWRHREEIDGAAWEGNGGEWHHLRLEEATFEHYGQEHTAYRWTTEHDEDGEWTLSRRRAERDAVRYAEEKQQQFTAFDTNDIPSLAKGADEAKRSTKLGIDELPKSKAKLSVSTTVNSDAMDSILSHLYGDDPVANERMFVQSLGMPDNAKINIVHAGKYDTHYGGDPEPGGVAVKVEIQHPDFKAIRSIGIDEDGNRFIVNHGWFMNKGAQGGGLGAEVFSRSVEAASQHGIDYITTHAAKSPDMNGYATWPKFGYDLPVDKIRDAVVKDELKQLFPAAKTIQDVFKTREGEEWWCGKKNPDGTRTPGNGTDLYGAKFDLDPGSVSMGRLRAYLATKMKASVSPTPSLTTSMPPATPSAPSKPPQTPGKGDAAKFAEPPDRLGPDDDPFSPFPEPIPFQPPEEAVKYFRNLIPTLGNDPYRYGALLERHAFTLAVATDQTLLDKVKKVIADRLEGVAGSAGRIGTATADIQDILDAAGVSTTNPQTAEMIFRTNMLDSMNHGQMAELQTPEMQEFFPVWQYMGIRDGRQGKDHEPKFDKYYPVSAAFADVRGPRVWNCRCSILPLHKSAWADLQSRGARLESRW